jgi:hypothetical protein
VSPEPDSATTSDPDTAGVGAVGTPESDSTEDRARSPMRTMFFDVVPSVAVYYGLRAFGADPYLALLGATGVATLRLVYLLWTDRRFDRFAAFMVAVFAIGLVLSFVTGNARFLLLKDSIPTAVSGAIFGISWLVGRPLMLTAVQRFGARSERERLEFETLWTSAADFRHMIAVMSLVWCFGLIGEAALRVPLIFLLPIDVMAGVSTVISIGVLAGLFTWTQWYGTRVRHG